MSNGEWGMGNVKDGKRDCFVAMLAVTDKGGETAAVPFAVLWASTCALPRRDTREEGLDSPSATAPTTDVMARAERPAVID